MVERGEPLLVDGHMEGEVSVLPEYLTDIERAPGWSHLEDDDSTWVKVDVHLAAAGPVDACLDDVTTGSDWRYQSPASADLADPFSVDLNPVGAPDVTASSVPSAHRSLNDNACDLVHVRERAS